MKKLTEQEVIRLMKEEWNAKIRSVLQEAPEKDSKSKKKADVDLSVEFPVLGRKEVVISPGLKVKSKKSDPLQNGLLYTVHSVDEKAKKVVLTHEKASGTVKRVVTWDEFNKEFERQ